MDCSNCKKALVSVFDGASHQYQDALHIQLHLGYGEFLDHGPHDEASPEGFFCENCARSLLALFIGFRRILGEIE